MGAVSAAALGTAVGLAIVLSSLLGSLEQETLTARFALRPHQHPAGVTIVAIDDRSFGLLRHRWPFPRSWHARVLEQLHRAGARAVFYDVQFTEPTTPREDGALFDALGDTGGAVLATTETDGHGHSNVLGGDAHLALVHSQAAASDFPVDLGGTIDRVPYQLDGLRTPAVVVTARVQGHAPSRSEFGGAGAYIDYRGPPGTFPTLSFADVLRGRFPAQAVRGRVIVVGVTSPTLQDLHPTPVSSHQLMSGAEIQANAIWTALHHTPLRSPPEAVVVVLILLAAMVAPAARLHHSPTVVALTALLGASVYLVGAQLAFDIGFVVPVIGPLAAITASGAAALLTSHLLVTQELHATQLEIVNRLGRAAEARDGATARHLERIAFLSERLAIAAGLTRRDAKLIRLASALHDVGKIAMPDELLLKPGLFDESDRAIMSTHTTRGATMLAGSSTSLVQMAEIIALTHHERWDGTGYPAGLQGDEIPLPGRICAICDVFDALISRRAYKEAWPLEAALAEIQRGSGSQFDPHLTALFLRLAPRLYRELTTQPNPDISGPDPADQAEPPAVSPVPASPAVLPATSPH